MHEINCNRRVRRNLDYRLKDFTIISFLRKFLKTLTLTQFIPMETHSFLLIRWDVSSFSPIYIHSTRPTQKSSSHSIRQEIYFRCINDLWIVTSMKHLSIPLTQSFFRDYISLPHFPATTSLPSRIQQMLPPQTF